MGVQKRPVWRFHVLMAGCRKCAITIGAVQVLHANRFGGAILERRFHRTGQLNRRRSACKLKGSRTRTASHVIEIHPVCYWSRKSNSDNISGLLIFVCSFLGSEFKSKRIPFVFNNYDRRSRLLSFRVITTLSSFLHRISYEINIPINCVSKRGLPTSLSLFKIESRRK